MGTTLTAFTAGSVSYQTVIAIESFDRLITDGDTTAAVTAWSGTEWSAAIGGGFVEFKQDQALDPDNPFSNTGGTCTVHILPDPADTFGVESSLRVGGDETYLDVTMDRNDTTATVKSTTGWASSGTLYIGTERCTYSGTTATTFTGLTRAKFTPMTTASGGRFAHHHEVTLDADGVKLQPQVTERPRNWIGRWVEVWAHRVVDGVLDTKANALRLFAGRIAEMRDDANTGCRVLSLDHALAGMRNITIGASVWTGEAQDGVYLVQGSTFSMVDQIEGVSAKFSNPLTVLASGASGVAQMNQGYFTHTDLLSRLSSWIAAERAASRTNFDYTFSLVTTEDGSQRTQIRWSGASNGEFWSFRMPLRAASFLGLSQATTYGSLVRVGDSEITGVSTDVLTGDSEPLRFYAIATGGTYSRLQATTRTGVLDDQYDSLPASVKPFDDGTEWGLFVVNDKRIILARIDDTDPNEPELRDIRVAFPTGDAEVDKAPLKLSIDESGPFTIRQIFVFEGALRGMLLGLLLSTGTEDHNVASVDSFPFGSCAALPYSLFEDNFTLDVDALPGAHESVAVIVDKPTKLVDLLASDLVMRFVFPVWRDGVITFDSWKTPTSSGASHTLEESNKAEPGGHTASQRSATTETNQWQRSVVKIRYNRDATNPQGDDYKSTLQLVDRVASHDSGGTPIVKTISLRNTYSDFAGTGAGVKNLVAHYLTRMPMISRPANIVRRSIDLRYFFSITPGDIVLFSDAFARDPETGARGITERPALVVRHMFTLGGKTPSSDKPADMTGEVELFFTDLDTDRVGATYAPSGDIDDTDSTHSFVAGYYDAGPTIRLYAHRYSESTEAVDASHFDPGDKVLILERDPLDPTNPTYWERTVLSRSSSDLTLTTALSSPAWDSTKKYRVTSQTYANATTSQRIHVYQADDADGLIVDTTQPFLYSSGAGDSTYTANTSTEIELVPDMTFADGFPRDAGTEQAQIRMMDNWIDYKSAVQQPMMFNTNISNTTSGTGSGYMLMAYWPIFLSYEILDNAVWRYLHVAPMARSSDGTSTKVKVSIWRTKPAATSLFNVFEPSGFYSSCEWTGITSTSYAVLTSDELSVNWKDPFQGRAWIVLELGYKCQSRGLSKCLEGARLSNE